jgi:hypothetical protein
MDVNAMRLDEKPYWEMSRLELDHLGLFDWLYKKPPPKMPRRPPLRAPEPASTPRRFDPADAIELVGYKPSEYRSLPQREPLRSLKPPSECGAPGAFVDMRTPVQITQKFSGDPILSTPIGAGADAHRLRKMGSRLPKTRQLRTRHRAAADEAPWEMDVAGDDVAGPTETVFHGIRLTVSRLHPARK